MAKKKAVPKKGPGRPPKPEGPKVHAFGLRGSAEWKAWLQSLATFRRREMADVIDEALEDYSEKWKFNRPPKR